MDYDLIIKNGEVVDGTGAARRKADVAVKDGVIVAIGEITGEASRVLDAEGLLVTPGFVDIHTHYDGQVSWDEELAPSCLHGVTTAVMGNCGVGFAPVRASDKDRLVALMEGVEDIPGAALTEGISWNWESLPEYMDAIDAMPHTIDFAVQIPHDALRVYVMGDRAVAGELATDEDIAKMRALTREALEAGAVGFATGRTDNHRDKDGSATPASEANVRELVGIAEAFKGLEHGVLQAVSDFDINAGRQRFDEEFDVVERMAAASDGHSLSMTLLQRNRDTTQWQRIIARAEEANEKGVNVRLQVAARGIGILLGLQATFHPFMGYPSYMAIAHLPLEERVLAMKDPGFKARLLAEKSVSVSENSSIPPLVDEFLDNLDFVSMRLYRLGDHFDYEPEPQHSILAEAYRRNTSSLEIIYDAMLEDGGRELLYFPLYNYLEQNLDAVYQMLNHPLALMALSDGGAHVGTVCDASFPTTMLTLWTRDRTRGERIPLEKAVHMLSGANATYMGFHDRGTLSVGKRADINVIDHKALSLHRPRMVQDLPAGGQRLLQDASGYVATFVAGQQIIDRDKITDARPGRLVRLGQ